MSCLAQNEHKITMAKQIVKVDSNRQKVHLAALEKVKQNVQATVIDKREVRMLGDIYQYYMALFDEQKLQTELNPSEPLFKAQYLLQNLLKSFPILTKSVYKQRTYLHVQDLPIKEVYVKGLQQQDDLVTRAKRVAFEIRKIVKEMDKRELPKRNLVLKDIIEGECEIPKELYVLIECLVKGPRAMNSMKKEKKISSICNSIIFSMSNGSIKPSSCIALGLTVKSMTGSRKVIDILNRMGCCISYTLTEELETELAFGSSNDRVLPYGLVSNDPSLRTHVAFDNFDKYVETTSGKDTLHDTVGIVYQNVVPENYTQMDNIASTDSCMDDKNNDSNRRRGKYYSNFNCSIEPYLKPGQKPSLVLNGKDPIFPDLWQKAANMNNLWMMNHAFNLNETKRWFAWNSERLVDSNPIQNIGYLSNLNMSPTSDAVVLKTLQIAQECNQTYIIVTYDLAIASKAYRIQTNLAPRFDNVFVTMGAFHIQLSFFKVSVFHYFECLLLYFEKLDRFNLSFSVGTRKVL